MGIGQKTTQKEISMFSIHIGLKYIYYILTHKKKIIDSKKKKFTNNNNFSDHLADIKKTINSLEKSDISIEEIKLIYYDCPLSIVPTSVFDKRYLSDYLKFNTKLKANSFINYYRFLENSITGLYVSSKKINNFFSKKFPLFKEFHYASLLISEFKQKCNIENKKNIFLNFHQESFDIIFFNNKKLEFYNNFKSNSIEDYLYYTLFTFTQLNINNEKIHVACTGEICLSSKKYEFLYKYVRNIEIINDKFSIPSFENISEKNILFNKFK
ncbi:MAG: hypothetical protein CND26_03370 [Bacteroidetes bacterium MED-G13]|nr:MAG: hypothetical protein CND26_03370 [Bacteroidetes bacterium MED-G13]